MPPKNRRPRKRRNNRRTVLVALVFLAIGLGIVFLAVRSNSLTANNHASLLTILPTDEVQGSKNATVTIYEFGDFQCPSCGLWFKTQGSQILQNLVDTGRAKLVWKDFDYYGPDSTYASEAARAAGEQGKFWAYHDYLFGHQGDPNSGWASRNNLRTFAQKLGLDMTLFDQAFNSNKYDSLINSSFQLGQGLGVQGTPTFFVVGANGTPVKIEGGQPYSVFEQAVNSVTGGA